MNKEETKRHAFMSMKFSTVELCQHLAIASGESDPAEAAEFVKKHFEGLGFMAESECEWCAEAARVYIANHTKKGKA